MFFSHINLILDFRPLQKYQLLLPDVYIRDM